MEKSNFKEKVQKWLMRSLNDPILKILAKNSNLTKTQLETLLIDILAANISEKSLKTEEKGKFRLLRKGVSRGSFNRTLRQARRNVIRSIYTILLLGYLGVLEGPQLDPFIEIANKLQTYMNAYKDIMRGGEVMDEHLRLLNMLRVELESDIERLSKPRTYENT